jgi:hypothetical protein
VIKKENPIETGGFRDDFRTLMAAEDSSFLAPEHIQAGASV